MYLKNKAAFAVCVIFSVSFKDVFSWTIDLPEARKFYFEKFSKNTKREDVTPGIEEDKKFYDNIHPNSQYNEDSESKLIEYEDRLHHEEGEGHNEIYHGRYADEYDYQSYMEKKVHGIVHNGSMYLEGLRKALYRYSELLKNCSKYNLEEPAANSTNTTWLPQNEAPAPAAPRNSDRAICTRATESSEHVRRLALLALWATRELQDRTEAYKHESKEEEDDEEMELLLRLAWFLDRLATLTGFEPDPREFVSDATPTEPTANVPTSPPTTTECSPGTDNCRFPLSMPATSNQGTLYYNRESIETQPTATQPTGTQATRTQATGTQATGTQSTRTQATTDAAASSQTRYLSEIPPKLTSVRSVQKRSVEEHPLMNVIKYYTKHKVWVNSNPGSVTKEDSTDFSVPNDIVIKSVTRRAVDNKKKYQHLQLPENPMQNISKHSKHKPGLSYTKDKIRAEKIREFLKKLQFHSSHFKPKKSVQKRSTHYEKMFRLRVPQDPQQDLSYYVKNRQGTNPTFNLVQASQVRAGLDQVYQTGNIEVIRRFGTNYNPAIPNPLMGGALRTFVDS